MQKNPIYTMTGAENSQPKSYNYNKIWTKSFVIAILIVVALGIVSLFTGVYDIRGQEDGMRMFFITGFQNNCTDAHWGCNVYVGLSNADDYQNRLVESTTTGTIEWAGLGLTFVYLLFPAPTLVQRMTGALFFFYRNHDFLFLLKEGKAPLLFNCSYYRDDAWA